MRISVCLATFNGEKYIRQQIESILFQLGKDDELIISDDGSKDRTLSIVESFADRRICIFHNRVNHGFIGNFENALNAARGDYIFLCDQDDIWTPDKVQVSLHALKKADLIVHDAEMIDAMGNILGQNYYSVMHSGTGLWSNFMHTRFLGCCMAFNRKVLNACLPFPKYITGHDYWIGIYALLKFRVLFISERLVYYRRHTGNVSSSGQKSKNSLIYKIITKRLGMMWSLISRWLLDSYSIIDNNCNR